MANKWHNAVLRVKYLVLSMISQKSLISEDIIVLDKMNYPIGLKKKLTNGLPKQLEKSGFVYP